MPKSKPKSTNAVKFTPDERKQLLALNDIASLSTIEALDTWMQLNKESLKALPVARRLRVREAWKQRKSTLMRALIEGWAKSANWRAAMDARTRAWCPWRSTTR